MIARSFARIARLGAGGMAVLTAIACASTRFEHALDAGQWSDAATVLDADSSLLNNEATLFRAAMLYSFPNRDTYNPARARVLFERLLQRYPETSKRQAAIDHLALLYELQRVQNASDVREQELQSKIAKLAMDTLQLRARIDSIAVRIQAEQDQSTLLRKVTNRLESDLQDREAQLRILHDELNHLKAIDLKPSLRSRSGDTTDRVKKIRVK